MRKNSLVLVAVFVVMASVVWASWASADDMAVKGRAVLQKHRDTVVTVRLTTKMSFGTESAESQRELTGTVVDATGLVVTSLFATDPMGSFRGMMGRMGDDTQLSSEIKDVKILLADGREVQAEVILRDKDLDLAFVRPVEKPVEPFPCVDMAKSGRPDVLDCVITLNRLGKVAGRTYSVSVERIEAIVSKPRTFFVPGADPTHTALGSPAFTVDGEFVGVLVMRVIESDGGSDFDFMGGGSQNMMAIVLPADEVRESANQAPPFGVKLPEEKPASEAVPEEPAAAVEKSEEGATPVP